MTIFPVLTDKKRYLPLLLLGDEQADMIDRYLSRGTLYVLEQDGSPAAVCVVTDEGEGVLEIKNLAVAPALQRRGYGRKMIEFLLRRYSGAYHTLQLGTGDSPLTVPFYRSCGFTPFRTVPDFFPQHYDHPIVEGGVTLRDMIYFRRRIPERFP